MASHTAQFVDRKGDILMSVEKRGVRFGIFGKILATMLMVSVIPLGIVWYLDYIQIRSGLEHNIEQKLDNTALQLANEVDQWVRMNQKVLQQNAALGDIASMQAEKQNPVLRTILKEYDSTYLVFTTDAKGINIGRSDGKKPKDYSDRAYVKAVTGGAPLAKQIVVGKTSGKPAMILAAPIPGAEAGSVSGVIAMAMHIRKLSERITDTKIGRTGFAFILDESGKVVAHQQTGSAPTTTDFSLHPAFVQRPQSGGRFVGYKDDQAEVVATVRQTETGWYVVTQQDRDEAYASLREAQLIGVAVLVLTLVVVSVVAFILARGLSQPIRNLTRIAEELSRGGTPGAIEEVSRSDEIGQLAAAIDRMAASIRLAIERLRKRAA